MPGSIPSGKSTILKMAIGSLTGHQEHNDEDDRHGAHKAAEKRRRGENVIHSPGTRAEHL